MKISRIFFDKHLTAMFEAIAGGTNKNKYISIRENVSCSPKRIPVLSTPHFDNRI